MTVPSQPPFPGSAADLLQALPPRRTVQAGDATVSYRDAGKGPVLLFLHGLLGSADSWAWQFRNLTSRYRVIAWDAPGYMGSSPADQQIDAFADRARAFIAALGLERPIVIGHSMGGAVAARLAALPDAPLSRLVLSCSHAGYAEPRDTPPSEKLTERIRTLREQGGRKYGQSRAAAMLAQPADGFALDLAARVAADTNPDGLFQATRMLQFADLRNDYARISMPVLVLFGARDPVVRPELSRELARLTAFATQREIPDSGHAPYLENAPAFEEAIETFIADSMPAPETGQPSR